jgi:hypothetical protein
VQSLHRGSHEAGRGTIDLALQEVIRNMHSTLQVGVSLDSLRKLEGKSGLTLAHVVDKLTGARESCPGSAGSHMSVVEVTLCMLTGLRPRTLQQVVGNLRRRSWVPRQPGGAGGRPVRPAGDAVAPVMAHDRWDDDLNDICADTHGPAVEASSEIICFFRKPNDEDLSNQSAPQSRCTV